MRGQTLAAGFLEFLMHGALKAAAVVICCTGWGFVASARGDQAAVAATNTMTLQTANVVQVDDPQPQSDGMGRRGDRPNARDGRDDGDHRGREFSRDDRDSRGRDGRDERDDGQRRGEPSMSRGHGRMSDEADGRGRGFGFRERGGREDFNFMRDNHGGRRFMHGGYDFMRGGSDFMHGGRGESGFRHGGQRGANFMHGGRHSMRDGRGESDFMRGGRGNRVGRDGQDLMSGRRGGAAFMRDRRGGQDIMRDGRGGPDGMRGDTGRQMEVRGGGEQHGEAQPKGLTLGVAVSNPDAELRSQLDLPDGVGLVVEQVLPNTLAASSGLKQYDVLQKIDDQLVINSDQVGVLLRMHKPGAKMTLTVLRHGKSQQLTATIGQTGHRPATPSGNRPWRRPGQGMNGMGMGMGMRHGHGPPPSNSPRPRPQQSPSSNGNSTPDTSTQPSHPQASISHLFQELADAFVD
jgi:hypothetical protein